MKLTSNEFRILSRASEGITRVTGLMSELIFKIADRISSLGKATDRIIVVGETLRIITLHFPYQDNTYRYLLLESEDPCICLFDTKYERLASETVSDLGYLEDPLGYCPPTREQKIWFLQHVEGIVKGFITLWQEQERDVNKLLLRVQEIIDKLGEESK